jgi:hypothetical protein
MLSIQSRSCIRTQPITYTYMFASTSKFNANILNSVQSNEVSRRDQEIRRRMHLHCLEEFYIDHVQPLISTIGNDLSLIQPSSTTSIITYINTWYIIAIYYMFMWETLPAEMSSSVYDQRLTHIVEILCWIRNTIYLTHFQLLKSVTFVQFPAVIPRNHELAVRIPQQRDLTIIDVCNKINRITYRMIRSGRWCDRITDTIAEYNLTRKTFYDLCERKCGDIKKSIRLVVFSLLLMCLIEVRILIDCVRNDIRADIESKKTICLQAKNNEKYLEKFIGEEMQKIPYVRLKICRTLELSIDRMKDVTLLHLKEKILIAASKYYGDFGKGRITSTFQEKHKIRDQYVPIVLYLRIVNQKICTYIFDYTMGCATDEEVDQAAKGTTILQFPIFNTSTGDHDDNLVVN